MFKQLFEKFAATRSHVETQRETNERGPWPRSMSVVSGLSVKPIDHDSILKPAQIEFGIARSDAGRGVGLAST